MKTESFHTTTETHLNHKICVDWMADDFGAMGPPWEEHDGHGPIRTGSADNKAPGERALAHDLLYDWQGAMQLAKEDGWGLGPDQLATLASGLGRTPTPGEVRAEAVRRDFLYCKGWVNDEWCWCGFQVTITDPDGEELDYPDNSCWGIESMTYCLESMESREILPAARKWIDEQLEAAAQEEVEAHRAACCDIATV